MTLERVPPRPQMRGQQTSRCAVLSATHRACPRRQHPRGRWGRGASGGTQDMCAGATQRAPRGAWRPSPPPPHGPAAHRRGEETGRRGVLPQRSSAEAAAQPGPPQWLPGSRPCALGQPSSGRTRSRLSEGSWLATGTGAAAVGAGRWAVSLAAGRSPRLKGHASLRAAQSVTGSSVKRGNPLGPRARFRGHDLQQETWLRWRPEDSVLRPADGGRVRRAFSEHAFDRELDPGCAGAARPRRGPPGASAPPGGAAGEAESGSAAALR